MLYKQIQQKSSKKLQIFRLKNLQVVCEDVHSTVTLTIQAGHYPAASTSQRIPFSFSTQLNNYTSKLEKKICKSLKKKFVKVLTWKH